MKEQQKKGRLYILAVIAGGLVAEASTFMISINIVRILLSVILWYFLYQGFRWAKYLTIALTGISGVVGAFSVMGVIMAGWISYYTWVLFLITTIELASLLILMLSKDANVFLDRKRDGQ